MENKDIYDDISSIKTIMERSTKFISLSGLSGILAGVYALIGAGIAYTMIPRYSQQYDEPFDNTYPVKGLFYGSRPGYISGLDAKLFLLALIILILSISTGVWLTLRKAKRNKQAVWNPSSRALLKNGLLPLLTGGAFILILLCQNHYGIISPACLIFYGLSLVAASQYTYGDVKWLGILEIGLGLICMIIPGYGLLFWALGFGVLHILYGAIMHFKYDRGNSAA
jgi:hypothetical protein